MEVLGDPDMVDSLAAQIAAMEGGADWTTKR
jgi:hypothetical protein